MKQSTDDIRSRASAAEIGFLGREFGLLACLYDTSATLDRR